MHFRYLIAKVVAKFGNKEAIFIPLLLLVFAAIATTQSVTVFIGFTPVIIMMTRAMGFDSITGAALPLLGGAIGFSTGTLNTSTTIVAQKIAELPLYSDIQYRFFCFFVFWIFTSIALIRYARKVKSNPASSPMYELDKLRNDEDVDASHDSSLTPRKLLVLLTLIGFLVVLVWGCVTRGWDLPEISVVFIWLGVISGAFAGFGPSTIAKHFAAGCQKLTVSALILGLARATSGVLSSANILDTLVYGCTIVLNAFPPALRGMCMYWVNFIINILVTSGSGPSCCSYANFYSRCRYGRNYSSNCYSGIQLWRWILQLHSSYVYRINGELKCCKYSLRSLDALYVENHASLVGSRKCPGIYRSNDSLRPHVTAHISNNF